MLSSVIGQALLCWSHHLTPLRLGVHLFVVKVARFGVSKYRVKSQCQTNSTFHIYLPNICIIVQNILTLKLMAWNSNLTGYPLPHLIALYCKKVLVLWFRQWEDSCSICYYTLAFPCFLMDGWQQRGQIECKPSGQGHWVVMERSASRCFSVLSSWGQYWRASCVWWVAITKYSEQGVIWAERLVCGWVQVKHNSVASSGLKAYVEGKEGRW